MKPTKNVRCLHLVGATGEIRTATFGGREHLVVPVVGMVEGVVWAVNSEVPELVTAEELALSPQQWNGRPCFAGHPKTEGTEVTANQPRVLERSFGVIFDTVSPQRILETRRLSFEAWLDPVKAVEVGPEAADVVRRLQAGELLEVSVGCYVEPKEHDGHFNGIEYHGEWTNIVSDHVAFLAADEKGACSVAAGCGAPRSAIRHLVTAEGIRQEEIMTVPKAVASAEAPKAAVPKVEAPTRSLKERMKAMFAAIRGNEGMSDSDVRYKLDAALRAIEPGYMWIENVYPDDGTVIYCVAPTDEYTLKRRKYTVGANDSVELATDAEEVEPVTTYETITAAATALAASPKTACACGAKAAKESEMFTERIAKLLANKHNIVKNEAALKLLGDGELKEVEDAAAAAEAKVAAAEKMVVNEKAAADAKAKTDKEAADKLAAAGAKPSMTRDEMLAAMPDVKAMLDERAAHDAIEHAALVTTLKAASSVLTEEQLKAKSLEELRTLAAFAKVEAPVDFSGRGAPRMPEKTEDFAPPQAYEKDIKALRERQTVN